MSGWDTTNKYRMFLKSREWKLLVEEVRQREGCRCENCGTITRYGHVHHTTYRHGWLCDAKHLKYLCDKCHEAEHYEDLSWTEIQDRINRLGNY